MNLKQAREAVGLAVEQCSVCRGSGCRKATLPFSLAELRTLALAHPKSRVVVIKEPCRHCDGEGWLSA